MYKRSIIMMAAILLLTGPIVRAENQSALQLSGTQASQVRANCVNAQSILGRLHANDGLTRVNLGQQYEIIANRLMAPLNSRIALNKLDGVALTQITVSYNKQLDSFRELYRQYEQTISGVLRMDCRSQPSEFYNTLSVARTQRAAVHDAVQRLNKLITQYGAEFKTFKADVLTSQGATK